MIIMFSHVKKGIGAEEESDSLLVTQGVAVEAGLQVLCSFAHAHLQTSASAPNLPVLGTDPLPTMALCP